MKLPVNYETLDPSFKRLVREEYIHLQNGDCYYCGRKLDEEPPIDVLCMRIHKHLYPDGFFKNPVHLHHDHDTGLTLGVVHAYCNAVLWEYEGE